MKAVLIILLMVYAVGCVLSAFALMFGRLYLGKHSGVKSSFWRALPTLLLCILLSWLSFFMIVPMIRKYVNHQEGGDHE